MTENRKNSTKTNSKNSSGTRKRTGNSSSKKKSSSGTRKNSSAKKPVMIPLSRLIAVCLGIVALCVLIYIIVDYVNLKSSSGEKRQTNISVNISDSKKASDTKENRVSSFQDAKQGSGKKQEYKNDQAFQNVKPASSSYVKPVEQKPVEQKPAGQKTADTKKETASVAGTKTQDNRLAMIDVKPGVQPEVKPESTKPVSDIPLIPVAVNNAKLVVIFDDGGQNLNQLEKCVTLPFPVTVAVLPRLTYSKEAADRVRRSGNEVMLHQPMQAVNLKVVPGPGAITPDMDEEGVRSVLFTNLNEIGPVSGVNNHEGSLITADAEKMSYVMKICSDEGIFFLDSRTNVDTKVPYVARQLGYSYYERNVFLDNTKVRADIIKEIMKGVEKANQTGCAIMIGHVWSSEILPDILKEMYPLLKAKGYKFVKVSDSGALKR